ncbi:MAG: carbohydrate ABC transporter permease [Cohnella sp.]|jgi:multiple sugar transport system permease protein|uniref:carbohydrate ABC transporter permease n=1 Tax=Cohnella sp. TaxID=1883426 RepID=UPI000E39FE27|nr:carbohydrate ABC transporter permease [Cohnella sp.]REK68496.1 MAG: carbohydrate ABC transporter permease [Cohnella sp.]
MGTKAKQAGLILIATVLGIFFIVPVIWMVTISLKSDAEAFLPNLSFIPDDPTIVNYTDALSGGDLNVPILRWIYNSLLVSVAGTLIVLAVDALAAYGLARLDVPFKKWLLSLFLSTLMIPGIIWFVPQYVLFQDLGLIGTYHAFYLPFTSSAFGVFLLYQFFRGFPKELEEAAHIDGANKWKIFYAVLLPSSKSILSTLAVLTFMGIFNDYIWPFYASGGNDTMQTLTSGIAVMTQGSYVNSPNKLMALSTIATIPVLVVFLLAQKAIVRGITQSGIK